LISLFRDSLTVKEKLLTYEKQNVQANYKFGVLFSREHQTTEDQMYNNGTPQSIKCTCILCTHRTSL
jgi:hypothetical protein